MNYERQVIFVIEKSASLKRYLSEILELYVVPTIHKVCSESSNDLLTERPTVQFGVVFFGSELSFQNSFGQIETYGPTSSQALLIEKIKETKYNCQNTTRQAFVMEGLQAAFSFFKEIVVSNAAVSDIKRFCILITQSSPLMHTWHSTPELLMQDIKQMGIKLSIVGPHKISELYKLFEGTGGDLQSLALKNYSAKPHHLVLLNGFVLQEHPMVAGHTHAPNPIAMAPPGVSNPMNPALDRPTHSPLPQQGNVQQIVQPVMPMQPQNPGMLRAHMKAGMQHHAGTGMPMGRGWIIGQNRSPGVQGMQQSMNVNKRPTSIIWKGEIEYTDPKNNQNTIKIGCSIPAGNNKPEHKIELWPKCLQLTVISKSILQTIDKSFFQNHSNLPFNFDPCLALDNLVDYLLTQDQAGYIYCKCNNGQDEVGIILLCSSTSKSIIGFFPWDQASLISKFRQLLGGPQPNRMKPNVGGNTMQVMNETNQGMFPNSTNIQSAGMMSAQGGMMSHQQQIHSLQPGMGSRGVTVGQMSGTAGANQMTPIQGQPMGMGGQNPQMAMGVQMGNQMVTNPGQMARPMLRPQMSLSSQQMQNPGDHMQQLRHTIRQPGFHGSQQQMQQLQQQRSLGVNISQQPRIIAGQMQTTDLRLMQQQQQRNLMLMQQQQQQGMRSQMMQSQQGMVQQGMTGPLAQQTMGQQQTMAQQTMGQQAMTQQTIGQQNMGQAMGQPNMGQQTMGQQGLGQQNMGQQSIAQQGMNQQSVGQHGLVQQQGMNQALQQPIQDSQDQFIM